MARRYSIHNRCLLVHAATLASMAGCARYEPAPLDPVTHARAFLMRSPDDAGVAALAARLQPDPAGEATEFSTADGLSMSEGEAVALFFNPDLRVARLRAGVARASADYAGLWQDPSLGFDGERIIESVENPWIISGIVGLTIPLSGSLEAEEHLAQGEHAAEIARVLANEWRVRIELRRAWLEWSAAVRRLEAAEVFADRMKGLVGIVHRLEDAGELARIESRLFYLEDARREVELRDRRAELQQGGIAVRRIMGLAPAAPITLQPSPLVMASPLAVPVEEAMQQLADSNSELQVARAEYEAAERTLQLEIRRQYPDLEIGLGGKSEDDESRILFGLSLPVPIWNRNQRGVATAQAAREVSRAAYESLLERAAFDLAGAQSRWTAANARRTAIEREVAPLADQQESDARRSAELGEVDTLLLLESVKSQYEAKKELIEAALDESLASIDMHEVLGSARGQIEGARSP